MSSPLRECFVEVTWRAADEAQKIVSSMTGLFALALPRGGALADGAARLAEGVVVAVTPVVGDPAVRAEPALAGGTVSEGRGAEAAGAVPVM